MHSVFWIILVFHISIYSCFILSTSNATAAINSLHELHQFLTLFNNEKQSINLLISALEQNLNAIDRNLQQKINNTEGEVRRLNTELLAEKTRRIQLQKNNDELTLKFYNLSLEYNSLRNRLNSLEGENANLKTTVQNLTSVVLANGDTIGFTAKNPSDGPSSETITFQSMLSNIGDHYNQSTGKFTCGVDGVYFFSLTLVKESSADHAWCYIRKNGQELVQAGVQRQSGWDNGWYGATNSAILQLHSGDIVDLGGCSPANTTFSDSTFTGFLIKAI